MRLRSSATIQIFLPRDAMHKRGLCRHAVSVRPSVTFVYSVKTKISSKFFHHRVATPFLFFHTKRDCDISTGTPHPNGGVGCRRGRQNSLQQARCCQHGRLPSRKLWHLCRWSYTAGIRPQSATRDNQSPSPWFYSARPTKPLSHYTQSR